MKTDGSFLISFIFMRLLYLFYLVVRNCSGRRTRFFFELIRFTVRKICIQLFGCAWNEEEVGKRRVRFRSPAEFLAAFADVFLERQNDFDTLKKDPLIVDAGANIGLSTIFLKEKYPSARVFAIEPDPTNIEDLKYNIGDLPYTTILHAALADNSGGATFYRDAREFTGGSLRHNQANEEAISVRTIQLADIIHEDIDYLKLDVEGMESVVMENLEKNFPHHVKRIFIEYHWNKKMPENRLSAVIGALERKKYEYIVESRMRSPFRKLTEPYGFNIFAYLPSDE